MRKTPYTIYDLDKLSKNYLRLNKIFKDKNIFYAVKANKLAPILETMVSLGSNFEVNTSPELDAVLNAGGTIDKIINSAPVKTIDCIEYMYSNGVRKFAYDSFCEIDKISKYAKGSSVFLRVYTSNEGSGQALNTKFGVNIKDAPKLIDYAISAGLDPFGITFSVGSQCDNIDNWEEAIKLVAPLFNEYPSLTTLDIGGGFPIEYVRSSLSINDISNVIENSLKKYFNKKINLYLEPGRYIVGNTGTTVSSVIGTKINEGINWCFVDVSIFGGFLELFEFEDWFSYKITTNSKSNEKLLYNIAGPTCDGCDILAKNILLPKIDMNSLIYFHSTGAYTNEYASNFNGFPMPTHVFLKKGVEQ